MERFTLEEFAQRLLVAYPELEASGVPDIELAREYFKQNPESPYLEQITNKDMMMPSSEDEGLIDIGESPTPDQVPFQPEESPLWQAARREYERGGSDSAAGFWKSLAYNIGEHVTSIPGAIVGYTGWGLEGLGADDAGRALIDTGEDLRLWGKGFMEEVVENDTSLMALQLWQQDEPVDFENFYQWDMLKRGMASALPSLIEMGVMSWASGGLATLGYAARGKKALDIAKTLHKLGKGGISVAQRAGGVATGVALEGSETWNTAMAYGKEQGMSTHEAAEVAGVATSIAAPIKGALEYFGFTKMAGALGMKEMGSRELSRILSGKVYSNMLARAGMKGLEVSAAEGLTEWGQFMTDAMVQQGYKEGFGRPEEYLDTALKVLREEGWSAGARESVYGGILMGGTTGSIGGAAVRLSPVETAARLRQVDERAEELVKELEESEDIADNRKAVEIQKALRYNYILEKATVGMEDDQKKQFMQEVDELYAVTGIDKSLIEETPDTKVVDDVKRTKGEQLTESYLHYLVKPRDSETGKPTLTVPTLEVLNSIPEADRPEGFDLLVHIAKNQELPQKQQVLMALKQNPSLLNDIINHRDKDSLLALAVQGIRDAQGLPFDSYDLSKVKPHQLEAIVRLFLSKGKIVPQTDAELAEDQFKIELGSDDVKLDVEDTKLLLEGQEMPEDSDEKAFLEQQLREWGGTAVEGATQEEREQAAVDAMMDEEGVDYDAIQKKYAIEEEVTKEPIDLAADLAAPATPDSWYWEMTQDEIEAKIREDYDWQTEEDITAGAKILSDKALIANAQYNDLKIPDLKVEINKRNRERGLKKGDEGFLSVTGKKAKLVKRLTDDDILQAKKPKEVVEPETEQEIEEKEEEPEGLDTALDDLSKIIEEEEATPAELKEDVEPESKPEKDKIRGTSGAAKGSDTLWDKIGKKFGVAFDHFVGKEHKGTKGLNETVLDDDVLFNDEETLKQVRAAGVNLNKKSNPENFKLKTKRLIFRNWHQIKNADEVFAIGEFESYIKDGKKHWRVKGGTGWGVEMAINTGKTVHFYDQVREQWHIKEKGKAWKVVKGIPKIKGAFAGIGTQGINLKGEKAIQDVYEKTFLKPTAKEGIEEGVDELEVSKLGVSNYKKAYSYLSEKYDEFAALIKKTMNVVGLAKGEKLWNKYASWYGDIDYTYTGKTHRMQKMPAEFQVIARDIEKKLGLEEGYFNSALANVFPKGEKLGKHADDEPIFVRDNKTIGQVATISLGGATNILISNNETGEVETIRVEDGDLYVMPGDKFQIKHKHEVTETEGDRISITFRHIPKARLEKPKTIVERFKGFWTREDVEKDTDRVYLFGDNTKDRMITHHVPKSTQAVIRGLANAIGIDTKKNRGTQKSSYLSDKDFGWFKAHVDEQIQNAIDTGKTIVLPEDGIGTGKAQLEEKAPKLFAYLQKALSDLEADTVVEAKIEAKNVSSNSKVPILAALTNPTVLAKSKGNIKKDYPVVYKGKKYADAEAAYQAYKTGDTQKDFDVMVDIIKAKFEQHANLYDAMAVMGERAGLSAAQWMETLGHQVGTKPSRWTGKGVIGTDASLFIQALVEGYKQANVTAEDTVKQSIEETDIPFGFDSSVIDDSYFDEEDTGEGKQAPVEEAEPETDEEAVKKAVDKNYGAVPVKTDPANLTLTLRDGKEIQLNDDQQKAYTLLLDWVDRGKGHFSLMGYAGTGKTTLIHQVIKYMEESAGIEQKNMRLAAPTHQAAAIMRLIGESEADTLAMLMGLRPGGDIGKYRMEFKPNKELLEKSLDGVKYVIIDEVSMINDNLLVLILTEFKKRGIKAVLMGDPAQLPPVGIPYSPAFKAGDKYEHLVDDFTSFELRMVMRQSADNPLFGIYNQLRYSIKHLTSLVTNENELPIDLDFERHEGGWHFTVNENGDGVYMTNGDGLFLKQVVHDFNKPEAKKDPFFVRLITGTKAAMILWNKQIRERIYPDQHHQQIIDGERLIPNVNRGKRDNWKMRNSIPLEIISQEDVDVEFTLDQETITIPCIQCEVADINPENGELINKRTINIVKGTNDNASQVWIDMDRRIRSSSIQMPQRHQYYKEKLEEFENTYHTMFKVSQKNAYGRWEGKDPDLGYGFASIVHKAQGSTYENAYVLVDDMTRWGWGVANKGIGAPYEGVMEWVEQYYNRVITEWDKRVHWGQRDRMMYTAFTRPSSRLVMLTAKPAGYKGQSLEVLGDEMKPTNIEYQKKGLMQSWDTDKILSKNIRDKLAKDFPEVDVQSMDMLFTEDGASVAGRALGYLVQWSKGKATLDTVPHEYAHVYINMFQNDRIVRKGIEKFGHENLASYMGQYYADRMSGSLAKRFGMWLRQFWLMLKKRFAANKLTDSEAQEYIASQFFSGAQLGEAAVWTLGEWQYHEDTIDTVENPSTDGETWDTSGRDALDSHFQSFFMHSLGQRLRKKDYADIVKMAISNDSYGDFKEVLKVYMTNTYPDNNIIWEGNRQNINESDLRIFWHKQGSKIQTYSKNNKSGRVNFEVIVTWDNANNNWKFEAKMVGTRFAELDMQDRDITKGEAEKRELVSGNLVQDMFMTNFFEEGDSAFPTWQLSLKNFAREFSFSEEDGSTKYFWKRFDKEIDEGFLLYMERTVPNLVYVGSKGGDHSAIYWSKIPEMYENMTAQDFSDYLLKELDDGNITRLDMKYMAAEGNKKYHEFKGTGVNAFAKVVTKHEWWKTNIYPKYMLGTHLGSRSEKFMGVQDHYDRLRIPGADGYTIRDFGTSSIMTVDAESMVLDEQGNEVQPISDYDGWLLSSGKWFDKLTKALGKEDPVTAVKGALFNRNYNEDGSVNYIATKSMQMRPYKGMQVKSPEGVIVAKYVGTGINGHWVDSQGNSFEHLSPTDTSKMTEGKYAEFNTIQQLEKGYQKITHNVSEKDQVAFPVTQAEMAMDIELLGTPEGRAWMDKINEYYESILSGYVSGLEEFLNNPEALYDELKKHKNSNDILLELDKYIDIIGRGGKGLLHPMLKKMWLKSIGNKYIKHGMMKLKSREKGLGTMLYYKPYYAPAFQNRTLGKNDFVVSSDNGVMVDLVEREYKKNVYNDVDRNIGWETEHDRISTLNEWLDEKYDNGAFKHNIPVLLSRQPIVKITGVVMRNVRHLKEGQHSQTMFLSKEDVLKVFDGDWDGDKGMIQIIEDKSVMEAYQNWQKSPAFFAKKKAVNLIVFGKQLAQTSMSDMKDVVATLDNINKGMNQIGTITNARNAFYSMHTKGLRLEMQSGASARPFSPTDEIVMDYLPLDIAAIIGGEHIFDEIYEQNGDVIVYLDARGRWQPVETYDELAGIAQEIAEGSPKKVYLRTTKENELANLLQMAVDDSKWGLLGKIDFSNTFLVSLLFKTGAGFRVTDKELLLWLSEVKSAFNFSSKRQGKDYSTGELVRMSLEDFVRESEALKLYKDPAFSRKGGFLEMVLRKVSDRIEDSDKWDNMEKPIKITYNWNKDTETPQEKILLALGNFRPNNPAENPKVAMLDSNKITFHSDAEVAAHRETTIGMNRQWQEILHDRNIDVSQEDIDKAVNFADKVAAEYHPLFIGKNRRGEVFQKNISVDYSPDVELIIDKWIGVWNNMSDVQKMLSTVYYLMGTRTTGVAETAADKRDRYARNRVNVFLPIDLLHHEVVGRYLNDWHDNLMSRDLAHKKSLKKDIFEAELRIGFDFNKVKLVSDKTFKKMCE